MSRVVKEGSIDFRKYADLEGYLFGEVGPSFRKTKKFDPEDFFAILLWKANRAKNKHRDRIMKIAAGSFRTAVRQLARQLADARSGQERLYVLMSGCKF